MTRVRRGTAHDVVPLLALMRALAVFEGYDASFRVGAADLLARGLGDLRDLVDLGQAGTPQFTALVAEDDGNALCGYAVLLVTPFTFDLRPTVVLKELYVADTHRRQGVAERLLGAVQGEALAMGAGRIRWLVLPGNEPAKRLYRRWGGAPDAGWEPWEKSL